MGNAQARRRIKASDFDYLAKNTNFLTLEVGGMAQPPWLKAAHKHTPVDKEEKFKPKQCKSFLLTGGRRLLLQNHREESRGTNGER